MLIQPSLRASTPGNGAHRRTFHAIGRQADLLNHLVENLISTAKIESDTAALADDGEPEPFVLEELTINYAERRVTVAGCPVRLTATEYRLLQELSSNAGRGLTQERLLRTAWSRPGNGPIRPPPAGIPFLLMTKPVGQVS